MYMLQPYIYYIIPYTHVFLQSLSTFSSSFLFFLTCFFLFSGSIKGRRSSYLLAITTERSKSCDEGLNTFRDEGRVFS